MSASHMLPVLRKLQARLKVSFSELQQTAFLNSKLSKRALVFGRHVQFTLGLKLQWEVFTNKVKSW